MSRSEKVSAVDDYTAAVKRMYDIADELACLPRWRWWRRRKLIDSFESWDGVAEEAVATAERIDRMRKGSVPGASA